MEQLGAVANSRVSRTRLKTPGQGAPRAEAAAVWSGQTAKSPRRGGSPFVCILHCTMAIGRLVVGLIEAEREKLTPVEVKGLQCVL